ERVGVAGAAVVHDAAGHVDDAVAAVHDQRVVVALREHLDLVEAGQREALALGRAAGDGDVQRRRVRGVPDERDGVRVGGAVDVQNGGEVRDGGREVLDDPGAPALGAGQQQAGAVGRVAVRIDVDGLDVPHRGVGQPFADLGPPARRVEAEHAPEPADEY